MFQFDFVLKVKIHHLGDCQAINVTSCLPLPTKVRI